VADDAVSGELVSAPNSLPSGAVPLVTSIASQERRRLGRLGRPFGLRLRSECSFRRVSAKEAKVRRLRRRARHCCPLGF
jgi:hypothetical protein